MDAKIIIEAVGYLGSALVLVSFLMTSVGKLRVVNTVGSVIFMTYALLIRSYPTALMNLCLVLINLRFLWRMIKDKKAYDVVRVEKDETTLLHALKKYAKDIQKCFPGIAADPAAADRAYLIWQGDTLAGILLAELEKGEMKLLLDYSLPAYRDFTVGESVMRALPGEGVRRVLYEGPTEHHRAYLERMGFREENGRFVREL